MLLNSSGYKWRTRDFDVVGIRCGQATIMRHLPEPWKVDQHSNLHSAVDYPSVFEINLVEVWTRSSSVRRSL